MRDESETRTAVSPENARDVDDRSSPSGFIMGAHTIGRYQVLAFLGAGGMGQVYAAYDPKLDRRVALKLLHGKASSADSARLEGEAKALARLSHPNVVAVYEVDEIDGRLVVALEYVEGQNLKQWVETNAAAHRSAKLLELLELLLQAGQGLAAAHRAGLVHRDVKPANVLVGDDGRVRVADFGLALASGDLGGAPTRESSAVDESRGGEGRRITRTGRVVGTPAYMAPEQLEGGRIDARSDQYAFCVTAWEALFGQRPADGAKASIPPSMPAPLVAALRKGLAPRPDKRHQSIEPLLEAMEDARDRLRGVETTRAKRRGRWWMASGVVMAGLIGGAKVYDDRAKVAECEARADQVDAVWNERSRQAVRAGLLATGASYAETTAGKVMPWLDQQAKDWKSRAHDACVRHTIDQTWSPQRYEKATWCLDVHRRRMSTVVDNLSRADEEVARRAVEVVTSLPSLLGCTDDASLASMTAPPGSRERDQVVELQEELAQVLYLQEVAKFDEALERVRRLRDQAKTLEWDPLTAEALGREASILMELGQYAEAEAVGIDGFMAAVRVGAWETASSIAQQLAIIVGNYDERFEEGMLWIRHAEVTSERSGDPLELGEAARTFAIGRLHYKRGNYDAAAESARKAASIFEEAFGPEHPRVSAALGDLGIAHWMKDEYEDAINAFEKSLTITEAVLGSDSPRVAPDLLNLGQLYSALGRSELAEGHLRRAAELTEKGFGPNHPSMTSALDALAILEKDHGQLKTAERLATRALSIAEQAFGPTHSEVSRLLINLSTIHNQQGEYGDAVAALRRAQAIEEESQGDKERLVGVLFNLADAQVELGSFDEAAADARKGLDLLLQHKGETHRLVPAAYHMLAITQYHLRNFDVGREYATRAIDLLKGVEHPRPSERGYILNTLGLIEEARGDLQGARRAFAEAVAVHRAESEDGDPSVAFPLTALGKILTDLQEYEEAFKVLEEAVAIRDAVDIDPTLQAESRFRLGQALWEAPRDRGRDRARAGALVADARVIYVEAGDAMQPQLEEMDEWRAKHGVRVVTPGS